MSWPLGWGSRKRCSGKLSALARLAAIGGAPLKRIVVLTGAGISAESGLKTFRGSDGLWEGHRVEDVACPEAWARDPARVLRFYNERRRAVRSRVGRRTARRNNSWPHATCRYSSSSSYSSNERVSGPVRTVARSNA